MLFSLIFSLFGKIMLFFLFFFKIILLIFNKWNIFFFKIYLFLERGEGKEKKEEKHQCVVASRAPPTGDLAHNPGMCSDWELNRDPLVHRPELNPLSNTSQGYFPFVYLFW